MSIRGGMLPPSHRGGAPAGPLRADFSLARSPAGAWLLVHSRESLSPAWRMETRGGRGRCLVATRPIPAGELLFVSFPAALLARAGFCGHCLGALPSGGRGAGAAACGGGCGEAWCGAGCAAAGARAHGAAECALLRGVRSPPPLAAPPAEAVWAPVVLAARAAHGARLARAGAGDAAARAAGAALLVPRRADVLAQRAAPDASVAALARLPAMLALAARSGVFPAGVDDAERLALLAPQFCNGFSVLAPAGGEEGLPAGLGLYPFGALMNHSCAPTVHLSYARGGAQAVRALAPLAAGDELTHAYVDVALPRPARAAELRERYGFDCGCGACAAEAAAEAAAAAAAAALGAAAAAELAAARALAADARELATEPDDARTHAALAAAAAARAWPPAAPAPDWRDARAVVALEAALTAHALRALRAHLGAHAPDVAAAAQRVAAAADLLGDRPLAEAGLWQRLEWLRARPALAAYAALADGSGGGGGGGEPASPLLAALPAHPRLAAHLAAIASFYEEWAAAAEAAAEGGRLAAGTDARRAAAADLFGVPPPPPAATAADLRALAAAASARASRIAEFTGVPPALHCAVVAAAAAAAAGGGGGAA
jgi:hypothetical protein